MPEKKLVSSNTRLEAAQTILKNRELGVQYSIDQLIKDADKLANFVVNGVETPSAPSPSRPQSGSSE